MELNRDIVKNEHSKNFEENMRIAGRGGKVAKGARNSYEQEVKRPAISKENSLPYKYIGENTIDNKEIK